VADALDVRVVSPARMAWEGRARAVTLPAWDGSLGVLPGHAPLVSLLGAGELAIDLEGGGSEVFHVAGGVVRVDQRGVTILTDYAEREAPAELPAGAVVHPEDLDGDADQ
jgi:F-type H+-transporting ATPase subunit epsilon